MAEEEVPGLRNHIKEIVAVDLFTAPWTAQRIVEASPWGEAPRYLL